MADLSPRTPRRSSMVWAAAALAWVTCSASFCLSSCSHERAPDPAGGTRLGNGRPDAGARRPLGRAEMEADLRELAAGVKSAWAYYDDKRQHFGVDVDALLTPALTRAAKEVESEAEFGLVVREFMAGLKEGHAEAAVGDLTPAPRRHWPFLVRPVKEGLAVTVMAADRKGTGIAPGDLLRAVNEKPIEHWVKEAERYVSASTPASRRRLAIRQMTATDAETLDVRLERPNGRSYPCQLATLASPIQEASGNRTRFADRQTLAGGVGYIRIPTFSWQPPTPPRTQDVQDLDQAMAPAKAHLDQAFAALAGQERLILDLRGNPGGSVFLASYVAEHLLPPGFVYHSGRRRRSRQALRHPDLAALPAEHWAHPQLWKPSEMSGVRHCSGPSYRGRLVVLIDELCFSATDDLAACLKDLHPDIRFVGRPTHGGTGEPREMMQLSHSGVRVYFCIQEMRSPNGRLIEGRGTRPDVVVECSRTDVLRGRDPDLAAGMKQAGA